MKKSTKLNGGLNANLFVSILLMIVILVGCSKSSDSPSTPVTPPVPVATGSLSKFVPKDTILPIVNTGTTLDYQVDGSNSLTTMKINTTTVSALSGSYPTGPLTANTAFTFFLNGNAAKVVNVSVAGQLISDLYYANGKYWKEASLRIQSPIGTAWVPYTFLTPPKVIYYFLNNTIKIGEFGTATENNPLPFGKIIVSSDQKTYTWGTSVITVVMSTDKKSMIHTESGVYVNTGVSFVSETTLELM